VGNTIESPAPVRNIVGEYHLKQDNINENFKLGHYDAHKFVTVFISCLLDDVIEGSVLQKKLSMMFQNSGVARYFKCINCRHETEKIDPPGAYFKIDIEKGNHLKSIVENYGTKETIKRTVLFRLVMERMRKKMRNY
jgi:hypothetical protein